MLCRAFLSLVLVFASHVLGSLNEARYPSDKQNVLKSSDGSGGADIPRRDAVKSMFLETYHAYEQYAFGYDVLKPITMNGSNFDSVLAGWGGTIVDAMSTMIVMGLGDSEEYKRALEHVKKTDFTSTSVHHPEREALGVVSLFELTIRYFGGLVSAYELNGERPEERFLVDKAISLADKLAVGWYKRNRIPFNYVNINEGKPDNLSDTANYAEAGTLTLEWSRLTKYTGDDRYRNLSEGSAIALSENEGIFPYLYAMEIYPTNESTSGDLVTFSGGTDSFYEYLSKYPYLIGDPQHPFLETYGQSIKSAKQYLVSHPLLKPFTFLTSYSEKLFNGTRNSFSHLACFAGANIALYGRLRRSDEDTQLGLEIAESCAHIVDAASTRLEAGGWGWHDRKTGRAQGHKFVSPGQILHEEDFGVFLTIEDFNGSPEIQESVLYGYRITGDPYWRDLGWALFGAMKTYLDTGRGIAGIQNVNDRSSKLDDETPTYFYAEIMKYLYLLFDDPNHYSLDDYVLNTEGHPFKVQHNEAFGKVQGNFPYERLNL